MNTKLGEYKPHDYIFLLRKRRDVFFFAFSIFLGATILFTLIAKPGYKAQTLIKIDKPASAENTTANIIRSDNSPLTEADIEDIQAPDVMKRAAVMANLISPRSSEATRINRVTELAKHVRVKQKGHSNMVTIEVEMDNPVNAANFANTIAKAYMDIRRESASVDIHKSGHFIRRQLIIAKNRLHNSEEALRNYREANKSVGARAEENLSPDQVKLIENNLMQLENEIAVRDKEISQYREILRSGDLYLGSDSGGSPQLQSLQRKLDDTREQIRILERDYTENYPPLTETRKKEKDLRGQLAQYLRNQIAVKSHALSDAIVRKQRLTATVSRKISDGVQDDMYLSRLKRDISTNEEAYLLLAKNLKEIQIQEQGIMGAGRVINKALVPTRPVKSKTLNIIIGVILGLILGAVAAVISEITDTAFSSIDEIENALNVPVLAAVPKFSRARPGQNGFARFNGKKKATDKDDENILYLLPTIFRSKTIEAEAYRHMYARLDNNRLKTGQNVYLFASSVAEEGKSITAINLAAVAAFNGSKTLLLSCDMRRPSIYKRLHIPQVPGLREVLSGKVRVEDAVQTLMSSNAKSALEEAAFNSSWASNLSIITAGAINDNPIELLNSDQMTELLSRVKKEYDFVFIDMPPILPVSDTITLANKVDNVILVIQHGRLPSRTILRVRNLLVHLDFSITGVVLNNVALGQLDLIDDYIKYKYLPRDYKSKDSSESSEIRDEKKHEA